MVNYYGYQVYENQNNLKSEPQRSFFYYKINLNQSTVCSYSSDPIKYELKLLVKNTNSDVNRLVLQYNFKTMQNHSKTICCVGDEKKLIQAEAHFDI